MNAANLDASTIVPFGLAGLPFYLDTRSALSDRLSDFAFHGWFLLQRAQNKPDFSFLLAETKRFIISGGNERLLVSQLVAI